MQGLRRRVDQPEREPADAMPLLPLAGVGRVEGKEREEGEMMQSGMEIQQGIIADLERKIAELERQLAVAENGLEHYANPQEWYQGPDGSPTYYGDNAIAVAEHALAQIRGGAAARKPDEAEVRG